MEKICRVSVILCTRSFNAPYLQRTLSSLFNQTFATDNWELILVVNARASQGSVEWRWASKVTTQIVHEERHGLLWARLRGLECSKGTYVVWMDDDARLAEDYLERAFAFMKSHSSAAVAGGRITPCLEGGSVPRQLEAAFALRDFSCTERIESLNTPNTPVGLGMVARRDFLSKWATSVYGSPWKHSLGRAGRFGGAGEDLDMVALAMEFGFEVWAVSELLVFHHITRKRLRPLRIRKLIRINNYGYYMVLYGHGLKSCCNRRSWNILRFWKHRMLSFWRACGKDWDALLFHERSVALLKAESSWRHLRNQGTSHVR